MKLSWKTLGLAILSVAALMLMTAMVVVSQGSQDQQETQQRRGPGGPGGPRGFGPPDGLGPLARGLNLTEDQKAQIQKINDSFAESTKDLHEQLRALHENEPNPFTTPFDEATVRAAAEARAKIDVELEVARAKMLSQIGTVLTTEQKAQIAAHHRMGPPPPPEQ